VTAAAAAAVLARIEGAGAAAALDADGRVRIARASRVPPEVVEAARRHRDELARLLAERKRVAFLLRAAEDDAAQCCSLWVGQGRSLPVR
jgi:hypothetical protein